MAGIVWRNGDLKTMTTYLEGFGEHVKEQAVIAMQDVVAESADEMRQIITDAHTTTGRARADSPGGGEPGRVETETMRKRVDHDVEVDGNTVRGTFGWSDPERYFMYQENGTRFVEAMHALLQSFISGRERFKSRVDRINLGGL